MGRRRLQRVVRRTSRAERNDGQSRIQRKAKRCRSGDLYPQEPIDDSARTCGSSELMHLSQGLTAFAMAHAQTAMSQRPDASDLRADD